MKKIRRILASPVVTIMAFALAVGLLLFSSVGGARAALTFFSENYVSDMEMLEIGVALVENGETRSGGDALLADMLAEGEELQLGKHYPEELKVRNTGSIDQYVRVSIYRYWVEPANDGKGAKTPELSPELIQLALNGQILSVGEAGETSAETKAVLQAGGWLVDDAATTPERMVLYYSRPLAAGDGQERTEAGESGLFMDHLAIDGAVAQKVEKMPTDDRGSFRIAYVYDGYKFCLDVKVDAVQNHNAADAILSAWGRKVAIDDSGTLSLQ